jgi:hypothetical protein
VHVVEVVGSRSRLVRIGVELRDAPRGKPQKGDLARSKPLKPLTRTTVARLYQRTGCCGWSGEVRKRLARSASFAG